MFKLNDPLNYALNPALDIDYEATTVDVAFILTFKGMEGVNDGDLRIQREVTGPDFTMAHWFRPCIDQGYCENTVVLETDWFSAADVMGKVFIGSIVSSASGDEGAAFPYQNYHPDNIKLELETIEMKLLVDMFFETTNSRDQSNNSTHALTYLLWERSPSSTPFEPTADLIDEAFGEVNDVLHFNEITLGPWMSFVNGAADGYSQVIADMVRINQTIQTIGASKYSIESRNQIKLEPGGRLRPDGRLRIIDDPKAKFGDPATSYEVLAFCQSQITEPYQANNAAHAVISNLEEYERQVENRRLSRVETHTPPKLFLYPNPARSELTVQTEGLGIDGITIYDTASRPVMQINTGGVSVYGIDLNRLTSGMYLIHVQCDGEILKERLIITK